MASKKDKQIFVDKEALLALGMLKEGILNPVTHLMSREEALKCDESGVFDGKRFPMSVTFAPNGRHNQEIIKNAKKGDKLSLMLDGKKRGEICVDEVYETDQLQKISKMFGSIDTEHISTKRLLKGLGSWAVAGDFEVENNRAKEIKEQIAQTKERLKAQSVAAVMMSANPFHRAHERLLRITLENSDMLVIFLTKPYEQEGLLPYELRKKTLEYFVENYVHKQRILIIPFDNTYLYADSNNVAVDSIIAKNFGCNKLVFSEYAAGMGMYYDDGRARSALDDYEDMPQVDIAARFVYCNECNTLVSGRTCPHGTHHHIKYSSRSLIALLEAGILPPAVLMRKDISAIILSHIHPNRFKSVTQIYEDLFPGTGLIETHNDEDFYIELMKLYQTTSLT
jgi:sulfate adenylyltransferase